MTHDFTVAERIALREHGIELFADRVIFDAQPPMSEAAIAAVQDVCAGPLPPALLALWRQTAGGRLAYDLSIAVDTDDGPRIEAISWCELSYNGNGRYRDLQGWIEHELELAEAMAEDEGCDWNGKLDCLPFGGFEYCDRIYAVTAPDAPDRGGIVAWKMGLPPAWTPAPTEDVATTFAPDLPSAFTMLALHQDPLAPDDDIHVGLDLLEYLDRRRQQHGMSTDLIDALLTYYRRAWIDWRGLLDAGTLAAHPRALRVALTHAVERDDAELLHRIAAAGCALSGALAGDEDALARARRLKKKVAIDALATLLPR